MIFGRLLLILFGPLPVVVFFVWKMWALFTVTGIDFFPPYAPLGWTWKYLVRVLWTQVSTGVPYAFMEMAIICILGRGKSTGTSARTP